MTIENEFTMIGAQFAMVGGESKDINELFAANSLPGMDANGEFQTTILVWDGVGYDTYGWMDADDGTNNEMPAWDSKWILNDFSDLATVDLPVGKAFWLRSKGDGEVTISGEVDQSDPEPIQISSEFTMIANTMPVEVSIQKIVPDDKIPGMDANGEFQTTILIWDGVGYDTYGWMDADDGTNNEMPSWDSKWILNDFSDLAAATLKPGQAAWFRTKAGTNGSVTFSK